MALGVALVDKARIVSQQATGPKVEGRTRFASTKGEWFKARLQFQTRAEQADTGGRKVVVDQPSLLFAFKDAAGQPVSLHANQRLEVSSRELGTSLWELSEEPKPLRKKRRVIGYEANLVRVMEPSFQPVVP